LPVSRRDLAEIAIWAGLLALLGAAAVLLRDMPVIAAAGLVLAALALRLTFRYPNWLYWVAALAFLVAISVVWRQTALPLLTVMFALGLGVRLLMWLIQLNFFTLRLEQYQRLVVSRRDGSIEVRGPSPVIVRPYYPHSEKYVRVDLREQSTAFQLRCLTGDRAELNATLAVFWAVVQPEWTVTRATNLEKQLKELVAGAAAGLIGRADLARVLFEHDALGDEIVRPLQRVVRTWGIAVSRVVIQELMPAPDVVKSLNDARAAANEKEAAELRAQMEKSIRLKEAEGKAEALEVLYRVASCIDEKTLNLRYLEAIEKLGESASTKFVLPLEFLNMIKSLSASQNDALQPPA
jgi:regulator of protease activity HflC (stomatin/prohibitin superfamily)